LPSIDHTWSSQLTSSATVHTHNGNGNGSNGNHYGNANGNGNHHCGNGTLPSAVTKKYLSGELANGNSSLKHNRTNSLNAINGRHANGHAPGSGSSPDSSCRLFTPSARSTNDSVGKPIKGSSTANGITYINGNGTLTKSYDVLNEGFNIEGIGGRGVKATQDYGCVTKGVVALHNNGSAGRKAAPGRLDATSTFCHRQPYVNNVIVTSAVASKHPALLSSDDDVYETVETPV
jgi:hypothetical protein